MKKSRKSCAVNVGRWVSYAAAGAVTAMAASNDAEAAILYSGPLNIHVDHAHGINTAFIKTLVANSNQGPNKLGSIKHAYTVLSPYGYHANSVSGTDRFHMKASVNGGFGQTLIGARIRRMSIPTPRSSPRDTTSCRARSWPSAPVPS